MGQIYSKNICFVFYERKFGSLRIKDATIKLYYWFLTALMLMKKLFMFTLLLGASGVLLSACMAQGTFRERLEERRAMGQAENGGDRMAFFQRLRDRQGAEGGGLFSGGGLGNSAASGEGPEGFTEVLFTDQGVERVFYVYRPDTAPTKAPALMVLHGGQGDAAGMDSSVHLANEADQYGFVAVYPKSYAKQWNDGREATETGISDVTYLEAVATQLVENWGVDGAAIYASGISSGGNMLHKVACGDSSVFAGYGILSATLMESTKAMCQPSSTKPMVFFHGLEDPLNTFNGEAGDSPVAGLAKGAGEEGRLSEPQTVVFWGRQKGCRTVEAQILPNKADDGTRVAQLDFGQCETPQRTFWIEGAGHTWPGGTGRGVGPIAERLVGKTTQQISAVEEMVKFFGLN